MDYPPTQASVSVNGSKNPKRRYEVWHTASGIMGRRNELLIDFRLHNATMSIREVRFSPVSQDYFQALGDILSGAEYRLGTMGNCQKTFYDGANLHTLK